MTDEQITAALGDLQRDRLDGEQSCYMDWYEAALRELRDTRAALQAAAQWCPTFPRGRGYLNRIAQLEAGVVRLTATLAQAREDLIDIAEYWNGDSNLGAMTDALDHITDVAEKWRATEDGE